MPFNTLSYFLFLPAVFLLHYFSPDRFRWLVLLGASFCFYAVLKAPHLIAVLLFITTITYFAGIWIDRKDDIRTKQYLLWGGISANVLTLIILKYLPFITRNLNLVLNWISPGSTAPVSRTIIAIGTSYFIFQAISYLIDVYLEIINPERHFGRFALYMSFFPKLLQGPIERGGDLLPQLKAPYVFNYENLRSGVMLFAFGLIKKVVVADRLALIVNPVFENVRNYKGLTLLLAVYYFALQIYFDFSGYTDMALGAGQMFNIRLTQNFNRPYFATSIADFWRRWHISFSRWILDYIFKPLQMSLRNCSDWGTAFALLITFTISGVWHGASWGFIIWGVLHGIYLGSSIFYKRWQKKIYNYIGVDSKSVLVRCYKMFIVFNMVCFGWVFFRANNLSDAIYIVKQLKAIPYEAYYLSINDIVSGKLQLSLGFGLYYILIMFSLISTMFYVEYNYDCLVKKYINANLAIKFIVVYSIIYFIVLFGYYENSGFIYNAF
jgi:D-alanyl-lipoteichoic acid acyltransferase DltB (MBOAT superfamily)